MNEKSRKTYWLATLVAFLIMVFGSGEALSETEKTTESTIIKIKSGEGWSYHRGDFELDDQGRPVGIHHEAAWTPYKRSTLDTAASGLFRHEGPIRNAYVCRFATAQADQRAVPLPGTDAY